jgi:hypothetical protein
MLRGPESAHGQRAEGDQETLVVAVVVAVQAQLGTCHQRDRVEITHISLPDLLEALPVGVGLVPCVDLFLQILEHGEDDDADGGQPLLAVDDLEGPVVR